MFTNLFGGRLRLAAVTLLFGVAFSSAAIAATGALEVKVTDTEGNPVAGAAVTASTPESLTQKSGTTGADGAVRLVGLDPSEDYVVTVVAEGFRPQRNEGLLVVTDRTYNVPFMLQAGEGDIEEIITYGRSGLGQVVDTTSSVVSTDVTLDFIESLPTGRTYQSYLQAAPTTKPALDGNPSSKSGLNYSDIVDANGNTAGKSSDNVYYIDGINITDNRTGTFGANFNSEIIQEQQIVTGGVPAEYEGGQGLVSRVITKSGGNEWHGSVNYYTQSDSLVA
ncbi:MAG: carboxypeptidase regulatory-like domain-containing protein, partial [Gammaproteobacteria bacterium]|nr:carboxypeptidase regulatory-like domain-containing protein [Gammaproteobacteria bacterium]